MPLDHYIPQVHLRNFYSPVLGERMYAMRKTDLKAYICDSSSQCRIQDGSTNEFLIESRAIEEFLRTIEGKYNFSVEKLRNDQIDNETIYSIAGFVAYVTTCSPAAMRIHSGPLRGTVEMQAKILEELGQIPAPPPELGARNFIELLESGKLRIDIDPKFPQAIGISSILERTGSLGNFHWEILLNDDQSNPFITSDYPVAPEETSDPRIFNRVVPLAPDIGIRIMPDLEFDRERARISFEQFRHRHKKCKFSEVQYLNRLLVRSAESTVYYCDDSERIRRFIARNRFYRVDTKNTHRQLNDGVLQISQQKILPWDME